MIEQTHWFKNNGKTIEECQRQRPGISSKKFWWNSCYPRIWNHIWKSANLRLRILNDSRIKCWSNFVWIWPKNWKLVHRLWRIISDCRVGCQKEHEKLIKWLIAFDRAWKRYARPRILWDCRLGCPSSFHPGREDRFLHQYHRFPHGSGPLGLGWWTCKNQFWNLREPRKN